MHDNSWIGINYAHRFPKCFRSIHTLLGTFALRFVSPIQLLSLYQFIQFLTCTRIPCRDSHCENGLVRCCLYTHRRLQQTAVSCKRSNCNKIREKIVKVARLRFYPKTANNGSHRSIMVCVWIWLGWLGTFCLSNNFSFWLSSNF